MAMVTAAQFVDAARSYLGVRWHHLGRSKEGIDCIGLLMCAAADVGLNHGLTPPIYAKGTRGFDIVNQIASISDEVALTQTRDGDILVFALGLYPAHMGIRSTKDGLPAVIHARADRRKVIEELMAHDVQATLRRVYRPRMLA